MIKNIYEEFADLVFGKLNENIIDTEKPMLFMVNFYLKEAKNNKDLPWKSKENWLTDNPKIDKNSLLKNIKIGDKDIEFETYLINMLPSRQSGINMCMCASKACASTCLHTSGSVASLVDKTVSRLRKSWFFAMDTEKAFEQIVKQIAAKKKKIDEFNNQNPSIHKQLVIRLNGTQDITWRNVKSKDGKTVFELFPDVMFYDYTKNPQEMNMFSQGELPPNYHLTFSYNGSFIRSNNDTLMTGNNLAVPFGPGKTHSQDAIIFPSSTEDLIEQIKYPENINTASKQEEYRQEIINTLKSRGAYATASELSQFSGQRLFPGLFHCFEVIDGDHYDARFLDDHMYQHLETDTIQADYTKKVNKKFGLVIGLIAKGALTFDAYNATAGGWKEDATGFMVGPSDPGLNTNACKDLKINNPAKAEFLIAKTDVYKKIAKAMLIIRNFDARHVHVDQEILDNRKLLKRDSDRPLRKLGPVVQKDDLIHNYQSKKALIPSELNKLAVAINYVFDPTGQEKPLDPRLTKEEFLKTAQKLKNYISSPEVMQRLKDPNFIRKAKNIGIDVNFESLSRLLDAASGKEGVMYKDPSGQSAKVPLTVLPQSLVKTVAAYKPPEEFVKESFKTWLLDSELLEILNLIS